MSETEDKARIEEDSKEFFTVRDLDEAEHYFTKLPTEHRHLLIDKLISKTVESKEVDAKLVASLFDRAVSRNLCSPAAFEQGFTPIAEMIDGIAIDTPKDLFAIMLKGAHLHKDEERTAIPLLSLTIRLLVFYIPRIILTLVFASVCTYYSHIIVR